MKRSRYVRWRHRLLRALRPRHLRDTWVHRAIGERLFDRHLWVPERETLAGGLAIGTFMALTPAYGVHMALAVLCAYVLRKNIPAAVMACWISNPFTAVFIYPAMYKLGLKIGGAPNPQGLPGLPRWLHGALINGQALWVGCLIAGLAAAAVVYAGAMVSWRWLGRISPFHRRAVSLERRAVAREKADAETQPGPPDANWREAVKRRSNQRR